MLFQCPLMSGFSVFILRAIHLIKPTAFGILSYIWQMHRELIPLMHSRLALKIISRIFRKPKHIHPQLAVSHGLYVA